MKRLLIIVSVCFAVTIHAQSIPEERVLCGGVERWSQKVLVDTLVSSINFTPIGISVASLVNIATPSPSTSMPRQLGIEDKTYSVVCNITIKKNETDNDFHLVLSDGVRTLIGEIPDPTCSAAASSSFVNQYIAARNFVNAHIAAGNVNAVNIPPVVVYGVAFIDPPHGQTGAAPNNLELHPILDIQFYQPPTPTAIKEQTEILKVNIFPNPVRDKLNIEINSKIDNLNDCSFKIYSIHGALIKTVSLPKSEYHLNYTISLEELKSGLYLYTLFNKEYIINEGKFVKE